MKSTYILVIFYRNCKLDTSLIDQSRSYCLIIFLCKFYNFKINLIQQFININYYIRILDILINVAVSYYYYNL